MCIKRFPLLILLRLLLTVVSTSRTAVDVDSLYFESIVQPDYFRILRLDRDEMWIGARGKVYFMDPETMQVMYERAWNLGSSESIMVCKEHRQFVVCDDGWPTVALKTTNDSWYLFGTGGYMSICREMIREPTKVGDTTTVGQSNIDGKVKEWQFRELINGSLLHKFAQVMSPPFPWIYFREEPDSENDEVYHSSMIIFRDLHLRTITNRFNLRTAGQTTNDYVNTNLYYQTSLPHDRSYNRQYDVLGIYQDKYRVYITTREPFLAVRHEAIIMRWCKTENFENRPPSQNRLILSQFKLRLRCQQKNEQTPPSTFTSFSDKFGGVVGNYSVEFKHLGATVVYVKASSESRIHGKSGTYTELPSQSTTAIAETADKTNVVFVGVFNIDMGVSTGIKYPGSAVCSFTQSAVDLKFDTVRKVELSNGESAARDDGGYYCEKAQPAPDEDETGDYVGLLLEKLRGDLLYEDNLEIAKLTALAVDTSVLAADGYDYDVLFAGTSDGRLIQLSSNSEGKYHRSNIRNIKPGKQIERVRIYHGSSRKHLIVNSFERVDKLSLTLCDIHSSCVSCVEARDPYCAWSIDLVKCVNVKEILKEYESDINTIRDAFSKLIFYNDFNRSAIDIKSSCPASLGSKRISTGGAVAIAAAVIFTGALCVILLLMWARSSNIPWKKPSVDPPNNHKIKDPGVEQSVKPRAKTQSGLQPHPSAHGGPSADVDKPPSPKPDSKQNRELPRAESDGAHSIFNIFGAHSDESPNTYQAT